MKRSTVVIDLILLELLTIIFTAYFFRGPSPDYDHLMHISKIKILLDNLNAHGYFPRWNPYWYFGVPTWRIYSPLSYYMVTFLGWIFHLPIWSIILLWTYLVFSISVISTYLLAMEMKLKRLGGIVSGILFLTSANLILYWGEIGSYPNVTGAAFSPLALFLFLRAIRKRSLLSILASGVAFSLVLLTYFMNAIILSVFIVAISILSMIQEPSLLYISRGSRMPPKYTMILPKILISVALIAVALSFWWLLPFTVTYMNALTIPGTTNGTPSIPGPLSEQFTRVLGFDLNLYSPGVGHVILALIGCVLVLLKRRTNIVNAPLCFLIALIFCFTPWLRIPTGPLFWWRFSLYFSLFASLCGGITLDFFKDLYGAFLAKKFSGKFKAKIVMKTYPLTVATLILAVAVYPVLSSGDIVFPGFDVYKVPESVRFLESNSQLGKRVGINGGYDFTLYTDIPQSGGGNIYYAYMINEFAYTFWYYMFIEQNSTYLQYFARNYNVRWFIDINMRGLREAYPGVYEVIGFNSNLAEVAGSSSIKVLFLGETSTYAEFFTALALANPQDIILVYGGQILEGYSLNELKAFDVIYLGGLRYRNPENLGRIAQLLSEYSDEGRGVILDTGYIPYDVGSDDIPDPFPVKQIAVHDYSHLVLNRVIQHNITKNVNFTEFITTGPCSVSYAETLKAGATALIYDQDKPVMAYWERNSGKILWMGLKLPYLVALYRRGEEAKFLINILRFMSPMKSEPTGKADRLECPLPEEILVYVKNATVQDAVWLKMSYYPGWRAQVIKDGRSEYLRIFQAGPNMMLVFPKENGEYIVKFYFDKTIDVQVGETLSLIGIVVLSILASFTYIMKRWITQRRSEYSDEDSTVKSEESMKRK